MQNNIHRIIDANVNRATEALRVLEDWVRYGKSNQLFSEKLKTLRHEINDLCSKYTNLILHRDSVNDVGRDIENKSSRASIKDIIRANCKRLEESLRVLSEYGQILNIDIKTLEKYRYEIYTIEKELVKNERLLRLHNARLYFVAGRDAPLEGLNKNQFLSVIEKSVEGGIDIIQLREKNESETEILELAKEIKRIIHKTDVLFILNDRVDLALAAETDGVHLGQDDMPINEARKITPEGFIIGLSTHSKEQGEKGLISGADYLGIGPVFPTPTKPNYTPAGLEYIQWASKNLKEIPWFAIGGIDELNIDKVINEGAGKIAVVRAIMNSKDPLNTTKKLKEKLLKKQKVYAETR